MFGRSKQPTASEMFNDLPKHEFAPSVDYTINASGEEEWVIRRHLPGMYFANPSVRLSRAEFDQLIFDAQRLQREVDAMRVAQEAARKDEWS